MHVLRHAWISWELGKKVCKVTRRWSDALATPSQMFSSDKGSSFSLKQDLSQKMANSAIIWLSYKILFKWANAAIPSTVHGNHRALLHCMAYSALICTCNMVIFSKAVEKASPGRVLQKVWGLLITTKSAGRALANGVDWNVWGARCRVGEFSGSEVTAHKVTLPSSPWRATVASRDGSKEQKDEKWEVHRILMRRGNRLRYNKIVTTCAPPLDYNRERRVWGVWLHVPAEAIRGSTCRLASFTLIWSGVWLMNKTKFGRIFPCTRGCSSGVTN